MTTPTESEVKLRVPSAEAARQALAGIGATLVRSRHFEDNELFDDRRGSLRAAGRVLRLRHNDQGARLTVKGPQRDVEGVKTRLEIEVGVGDGAGTRALLEQLGYERVFRYQKYREVWHWNDAEVVVDETPVGTFLEVEGPIETIHAAARALGRGPGDYIRDSYVALFVAAGGQGDMVFDPP
jgi:adenylate cyclase class 2